MAYTKDQLTALQKEASNYGGFTDQKFIDYVNQKGGAGSYDTIKTNIQGMQGQPTPVTTTPKVQDPINTQTGTPVSANPLKNVEGKNYTISSVNGLAYNSDGTLYNGGQADTGDYNKTLGIKDTQPIPQSQLNAPQTIKEVSKVETPAKVTPTAKTEQFDINKPSYQDTINEQVKQGNTESLKAKLNEGLQAGTLDQVQYNKMMNSIAQSETQQAKALDNPDNIFNFLNTGVTISEDLKQSANYTKAKSRYDNYQMLSGLNSSQLGSLLSNGTLLPGTTAYNDLIANPEMKIKLDKINQLNLVKGKTTDINKVIETKSNEIANNTEVTIGGQKMTLKSALEDGFIDQNEFNAMTNTPQMTAKYQEVEDMRNEYDEQLATYKNIKTDIENRLKGTGATKTDIARAVAQAQEDLLPGLQATESRLNNAIGTLTQMKTDASQMFATNLGLYKESQARQQQLEDRAYNEQQAQKQLEQKFAYEYGDINSTDPNIQRVAFERIAQAVQEQYKGMPFRRDVSTMAMDFMNDYKSGKSIEDITKQVTADIQGSPYFENWKANNSTLGNKTTSTQDWSKLDDTTLYNSKTGETKQITTGTGIVGNVTISAGTTNNRPDRNNNPGNVKIGDVGYGVDDQKHTIFGSVEDGYQAMVNDINAKLTGGSKHNSKLTGQKLSPESTLADLGSVYAEDPKWANSVAKLSGYNTLTKLKDIDVNKLAPAIAKQEGFTGSISTLNNDFNATDTRVFNSLTASEKAKKQSDPKYINFVNKQNEVYNNPDATIEEILTYSAGGADLGETSIQQLSKFNQALSQVGELSKNITKETTGPIIGKLKSYNPYDSSAQALKAEINSLIPNIARGVYGEVGVLTDADIENYRKTLPNLTSTEATNKLVLAMTLKTMMNGYKGQLQTLAGSNKDVSKLQGKYKEYEQTINSLLQSIGATGTTPTTTQNQSSVTGKSGTTYTLKPKQ